MSLRNLLLACVTMPILLQPVRSDAGQTPLRASAGAVDSEEAFEQEARRNIVALIDKLNVPYESFTLANGLRVIVHTDHRSPLVSVAVWYDVGSKHEAPGRSGFAHLFEHLMFNGSENVPGDYVKPLMEIGAQVNGSTSKDRTNYYAVVPTPALERALFMESDRMGHLLGALSQETLDEQREVVQNEKRNGDASPTSIVRYMTDAAIYPPGHPYGHSTIGSMKDLKAANLHDVRQFFQRHYGPNNATIILAGDIDLALAKRLVTRYFGDIPRGPRTTHASAGPVQIARTIQEEVTAPVPTTILTRSWPVPGVDQSDGTVLDLVQEAMSVGEAESPGRRLVREQRLFSSFRASNETAAHAGVFRIEAAVRKDVDVKQAQAAFDREIALFLSKPPSAEGLLRSLAKNVYRTLDSLKTVEGRGEQLGEGLAHGDIAYYKSSLRRYAAQTPDSVWSAARRWLERPSYDLVVSPGPRVTPKDDDGIAGASQPSGAGVAAAAETGQSAYKPQSTSKRGPLPPVAASADARIPAIERARLANGMPVLYAHDPSVPSTFIKLRVAGGMLNVPAADVLTMETMYLLLSSGYGGRDEDWINRRNTLLGLQSFTGVDEEYGSVTLDVPNTSLKVGLDGMREMITQPDFASEVIERRKRALMEERRKAGLAAYSLLNEAFTPLLDAESPYAPLVRANDPASINAINRDRIVAAFERWLRPEHAHLEIISSLSLRELLPILDETFASWKPASPVQPVPPVKAASQPGSPQIVLVNLPGAVQALVRGGQAVSLDMQEPTEAASLASEVLGSSFTSRINMNLREAKHWTYGVDAQFHMRRYGSHYAFNGEIQQDRVGPAIAEVMREVREISGPRPITATEFTTAKTKILGALPASFADRSGLAGAMSDIHDNGRPDDFVNNYSHRYREVTLDQANAELKKRLSIDRWVWTIVGDASIIRPQLDTLGLPVKVIEAKDLLPPL